MKKYDNQCVEILKKYPKTNGYLATHYNKSKELKGDY